MIDHAVAATSRRWPALPYAELEPTIEHVRRLVQIAGKYTLDQTFEPAWGNIVLNVTGRGLATPTLRADGVTFVVHYRLLDDDVVVEADTGVRVVPVQRTVGDFYAAFVTAAAELGVPAPGSTVAAELGGSPDLDRDDEVRPWDPAAARLIWAGFDCAAEALERWQAPYRGHRPRVGVMWGGFDLSATRYRAVSMPPPKNRPAFMQHSMNEQVVALGFSFGSPDSPVASFYAYIAPQPDGLDHHDWGVEGAGWHPDLGLAVEPWDIVRAAADPAATVVAFADAVYAAAVRLGGWPADLVGPRETGWYASHMAP